MEYAYLFKTSKHWREGVFAVLSELTAWNMPVYSKPAHRYSGNNTQWRERACTVVRTMSSRLNNGSIDCLVVRKDRKITAAKKLARTNTMSIGAPNMMMYPITVSAAELSLFW